jgi:hypothetical protein
MGIAARSRSNWQTTEVGGRFLLQHKGRYVVVIYICACYIRSVEYSLSITSLIETTRDGGSLRSCRTAPKSRIFNFAVAFLHVNLGQRRPHCT